MICLVMNIFSGIIQDITCMTSIVCSGRGPRNCQCIRFSAFGTISQWLVFNKRHSYLRKCMQLGNWAFKIRVKANEVTVSLSLSLSFGKVDNTMAVFSVVLPLKARCVRLRQEIGLIASLLGSQTNGAGVYRLESFRATRP
jgi:hypothetical protein